MAMHLFIQTFRPVRNSNNRNNRMSIYHRVDRVLGLAPVVRIGTPTLPHPQAKAPPPLWFRAWVHACGTREQTLGGFIKCILRGVRCTKSLRVLFLHRRPPSWTTLVLYSRAVFILNEPAYCGTLGTLCYLCR